MDDSPRTFYDPLLSKMRLKGPQGLEGAYKVFAKRQVAAEKAKANFATIHPQKHD